MHIEVQNKLIDSFFWKKNAVFYPQNGMPDIYLSLKIS